MTFDFPLMLFGLLLVLPVAWMIRRGRRLDRMSAAEFRRIPALAIRPNGGMLPAGWFSLIALLFLGIAMAAPEWGRQPVPASIPGRDLVVVMDLSRSMRAEVPSRLAKARTMLDDLAEGLRRRPGQRVGLVVFAGMPRLLCPLTHDVNFFRECLSRLDIDDADPVLGEGTRIGSALIEAVTGFEGRSAQAGEILLVSDGDDPARDGEWKIGLDRAREVGLRVDCLAVGDPHEGHRIPLASGWMMDQGREVRSRREDSPLMEIAHGTGGTLWTTTSESFPLGDAYLTLRTSRGVLAESPDRILRATPRPAWFLLPAALLLLLSMPGLLERRQTP